MQVVVELRGDVVHNPGTQLGATRSDSRRTELGLGLRFENWFLNAYGDGADNAVTYVGRIQVLLEVVAGSLHNTFAEGLLVRTALRSVLAVHEAVVVFAVLVAVGKGDFDIICLKVSHRVTDRIVHVVLQQVQKAVRAVVGLAVHHQRKAVVQIGVVPDLFFHVARQEAEILENAGIRFEIDFGTVLFGRILFAFFADKLALAEFGFLHATVAETLDDKLGRKGVHRLGTHTVQAHGLLEGFGVVLTTGVNLRYAVDDLAERNTAAKVAHAGAVVFNVNDNLLAGTHHEFVDGVVDNFFHQHVNAVVGAVAVAELADVHTRTFTDMFVPFQCSNAVFGILCCCHSN